jgi:hypothetical protein
VNETSGTLDVTDRTRNFARSCDHLEVNKFADPEEQDFELLVGQLKKMIAEGPGLIHRRTQSTLSTFSIGSKVLLPVDKFDSSDHNKRLEDSGYLD